MRQVDHRSADPPPARSDVRHDPVRGTGRDAPFAARASAAAASNADGLPGSVCVLEPAEDGGADRGPALPDSQAGQLEGDQAPGRRAARGRRPQSGAHEPLPARVLRRTASANRGCASTGSPAPPHRLRRAGLGARRLGSGPDPQSPALAAEGIRPHLRLHLARSVRDASDLLADRRDVSRPDRRDWRTLRRSSRIPSILIRPCSCPPFPGCHQAWRRGNASSWEAMYRPRSTRRPRASSTRAARDFMPGAATSTHPSWRRSQARWRTPSGATIPSSAGR